MTKAASDFYLLEDPEGAGGAGGTGHWSASWRQTERNSSLIPVYPVNWTCEQLWTLGPGVTPQNGNKIGGGQIEARSQKLTLSFGLQSSRASGRLRKGNWQFSWQWNVQNESLPSFYFFFKVWLQSGTCVVSQSRPVFSVYDSCLCQPETPITNSTMSAVEFLTCFHFSLINHTPFHHFIINWPLMKDSSKSDRCPLPPSGLELMQLELPTLSVGLHQAWWTHFEETFN